MNIFQLQCKGFLPATDKPSYHEQWLAGSYTVSGIFPLAEENITPAHISNALPQLLQQTKQQKVAKIPQWLCMYFLIPIYCAESFSTETIDWAHCRKLRWGVWHHPILFNNRTNDVHCYKNWGRLGTAFLPFLQTIIFAEVCAISQKYGFEIAPTLDGHKFYFRCPRQVRI